MFAGHFGLAAGVKSQEPEMPLWALMLSTQLLDVLFVPMYLAGIETTQRVPGAPAYGGLVIHANYTHSLVGALLNFAVAGLVAARFWGRRSGLVIGGVAFSHWILGLLVHRADLPILPGNVGGLPTLGLGLWAQPGLSAALEAALIGFDHVVKRFKDGRVTTESVVMRASSGTVRWVRGEHHKGY